MAGVYRQPPPRVQRQQSFIPSVPPKISGTATTAQAAQSDALSGKLIFRGADTTAQAAQSSAASGKEKFSGSIATAQSQTDSVAAKLIFSGSDAGSQAHQNSSVAGKEIFSASITTAQAAQVSLGSEKEIFVGSAATSQAAQSSIATGTASSGQQSVGRLSRRRKLSGGVVPRLIGELPHIIPPLAIAGKVSTSQRRSLSAISGNLHFIGEAEQFQAQQDSQAFGEMIDTEMETILAIMMQVA